MLVTFKSRAHADITMFGDVALRLIKWMGRRDSVPSAILPEDIPQALKMLKAAIAKADTAVEESELDVDDEEKEKRVSIHNRALPLIELLETAQEDDVPVMWEEGGRAY
jgi:hypothetical protein